MAEDTGSTVGGPSTAAERSSAPHKRARKSHVKSSSSEPKGSGRNAGQDRLQKSAVERVEAEKADRLARDKKQLVSTKLQTKAHVGKHPAEPDKHDEVEHEKVGLTDLTGGEDIDVKTIDQKVEGKHVDTIAVVKGTGPTVVGGAHPLSEGQRTQQAIDDAGEGPEKKKK